MKEDFDKVIRQLMAKEGIKTVKELADRMNVLAGRKIITANSVGKWLRPSLKRKAEPKATSLMFLAKALKISADLLLFDEGEHPEKTKSLERMVSKIVEAETRKILKEDKKDRDSLNFEFDKLLTSHKIPQEDKESILRQMKNLLKLYPNGENNN